MIHVSLNITSGGTSQKVAISTVAASTAAIAAPTGLPTGAPVPVVLAVDVDAFVRRGANPTAVSDGTDQFVPAGILLRTEVQPGEKLSFITASGSGNAYVTPGV
jgi:hypothetical protein